MLDPANFRAIVSGQRQDVRAALWRGGLRLAEVPYTLAVRWRNRRFDVRRAAIHKVSVPVISVGNVTLGGTGKTPMVAWLARWFRTQDVRVSLVSRGYKAAPGARNDEAVELEQQLPDVPHLQNPDRVEAAQTAIAELETQLILLDDGFQHRRLARDLDIVLIDALEPFGYGHVFPRGTLREPLDGLRRAQIIALSRADTLAEADRAQVHKQVQRYAPESCWIEVAHQPAGLRSASGQQTELTAAQGWRVAAFCGLGNPAGFRHSLARCGVELANFREFPDHHAYSRQDVEQLARWANQERVDAVLCTHKDLVKVGVDSLGGVPLWAFEIRLQILSGQTDFEARLDPLARQAKGL